MRSGSDPPLLARPCSKINLSVHIRVLIISSVIVVIADPSSEIHLVCCHLLSNHRHLVLHRAPHKVQGIMFMTAVMVVIAIRFLYNLSIAEEVRIEQYPLRFKPR